ncbi:diguanylate cyclase [Oleiagrimonas sp. C23AA]|nr:diguanylate cyclase [Oleiagrimonas sp. C23AA]
MSSVNSAHRERFYRSVAETLALLHAARGRDRRQALGEVADALASTLQVPLVWIGWIDAASLAVEVMAAAGSAKGYAETLHLSLREGSPDVSSPLAQALRDARVQLVSVDSPIFAPWQASARHYGLVSSIVAVSATNEGGHISLAVYADDHSWTQSPDLADWAQRLVSEMARFWDHQALLERDLRLGRYREAQRRIQRALLRQPDPDAVFHTLAEQLVKVAGAAAVGVFVAEEGRETLVRRALAGPMAEAMAGLPEPGKTSTDAVPYMPTQAFMSGQAVVRVRPGSRDDVSETWKHSALNTMGALGCWPFSGGTNGEPAGVFAVATYEADAFDGEMHHLFDELAEAAGLALERHRQHHALAQERERQTQFALHDPLTGLPNRRALEIHLDTALAEVTARGHALAVGLLDLDDFKPINDTYGHAVGDRVLIGIAKRLQAALPAQGYAARLGGDEFVLVFELVHGELDLDVWLAPIWKALHRTISIDDKSFELSASLGIALYPDHASGSGDQLLRFADQAMYRVKADKQHRSQWWSLPHAGASVPDPENVSEPVTTPHGAHAAAALMPWTACFEALVPTLVGDLVSWLEEHAGAQRVLKVLPDEDLQRLKALFARRVRQLLAARVNLRQQRRQAFILGCMFAASGVEEVTLLEAAEYLRDLVASAFGAATHRDRRPVGIVLQRLAMERQWQIEGMRQLQRTRMRLLSQVSALAWSASSYLELIRGVVDVLIRDPEACACTVGRPDEAGCLVYEAVGGDVFKAYLRAVAAGQAAPISVRESLAGGSGPSGRAWRSASIQRTGHYASDAAASPWRDVALSLGVRSNVAVPLFRSPGKPEALLTLYSSFPGGFCSDDQQAFLEQVKTVLDLALARLSPRRHEAQLLPFVVRDRWRRLLPTPALQMHYQPLVCLRRGQVIELEALARLRDENGQWLLPGRFLHAFSEDDLLLLFERALQQATACRQRQFAAGRELDIAVNLPASALHDRRYVQAAERVLSATSCPPGAVLLEVLESPLSMDEGRGDVFGDAHEREGLLALKALGPRLVEDDLGSGYSSLIRLRQWPFDRVKIDQAIVRQVREEPLQTLRFIRQLVRLGHELDMEVTLEGLESAGLVEAALILDADTGQGFALARPMPEEQLDHWLPNFRVPWHTQRPVTAMGALASAVVWEERLVALASESDLWGRFAASSCGVSAYLRHHPSMDDAFLHAHDELHARAAHGPMHPDFRRARDTFMEHLVAQVMAEEHTPCAD